MKTLAEMNAKQRTSEWQGYTLADEYAVGRVGRARSGTKIHLLRIERVLYAPEGGKVQVGGILSAHAPCNGNGQHVGQVVKGLDTDAITCTHCNPTS